jgi:hypothetical protein
MSNDRFFDILSCRSSQSGASGFDKNAALLWMIDGGQF